MVFLIVKKGYDSGFNLYSIFQILTCLTVILWVRTYFLLPKKTIPFPLLSNNMEFGWQELRCFRKKKISGLSSTVEGTGLSASLEKVDGDEEKISFKQTLKNILFWTNLFHYSVIGIRLVFFISSLLTWLRTFKSPENISELVDNFGFILLFGVCVSPINGIILDFMRKLLKSRTAAANRINLEASFRSMLITSVLSIIYSALVLFQFPIYAFVFHLLTRGFIYGGFAAFIASNFPFYHFGKLFGLAGFLSGTVAFFQYGVFQIAVNFEPDFYYINIGWLIACILTSIHPLAIFLQIQTTSYTKKESALLVKEWLNGSRNRIIL